MIVAIAEVMPEEEVAIFVVIVCRKLKWSGLCSTLRTHSLGLCLLLTHHHAKLELSKLHFGMNPKERGTALDERIFGL